MAPHQPTHSTDPRERATFYAVGLLPHDPVARRWPGGDVPFDEARRSRILALLDRARQLVARPIVRLLILAPLAWHALPQPASADVRITHDVGGSVKEYESRVWSLQHSGERVVVDGLCASACTLHLALPAGRVCATDRAVFLFHSATSKQFGIPDWRTNEQFLDAYPPRVRFEVMRRGGLWLTPIRIKGTALLPRCDARRK